MSRNPADEPFRRSFEISASSAAAALEALDDAALDAACADWSAKGLPAPEAYRLIYTLAA